MKTLPPEMRSNSAPVKLFLDGQVLTRYSLLILLALLSLAHGGTVRSEVFESANFTIDLPENWDGTPQKIMEDTVLFYTLSDLDPQASLVILVQKESELDTIGLLEATKAAIKEKLPETRFLLEREVEQDGARWSELIYTYSGIEFLQLVTVRNGYRYVFTVTTLEAFFGNRLPESRRIFSTWHFR
jgi:hypothetical protein